MKRQNKIEAVDADAILVSVCFRIKCECNELINTAKMECFLCDNMECDDLNIWNSNTKYRNIPLSFILYEFMRNDVEIAIEIDERICQMCKLLLDELDLVRYKLVNIENILAHKLHRKYKVIDSSKALAAIRIDEQAANLFACGNSNESTFKCKKCSYSTNFQDCLVPHTLIHRENATENSHPIMDFQCKHCHLILPSEILLHEHLDLFHSNETADDNSTDLTIETLCDETLECDNKQIECIVSLSR